MPFLNYLPVLNFTKKYSKVLGGRYFPPYLGNDRGRSTRMVICLKCQAFVGGSTCSTAVIRTVRINTYPGPLISLQLSGFLPLFPPELVALYSLHVILQCHFFVQICASKQHPLHRSPIANPKFGVEETCVVDKNKQSSEPDSIYAQVL